MVVYLLFFLNGKGKGWAVPLHEVDFVNSSLLRHNMHQPPPNRATAAACILHHALAMAPMVGVACRLADDGVADEGRPTRGEPGVLETPGVRERPERPGDRHEDVQSGHQVRYDGRQPGRDGERRRDDGGTAVIQQCFGEHFSEKGWRLPR